MAENKLKNKVSSLEDYAIEVVAEPEQTVCSKLVFVIRGAVLTENVWVAVLEAPQSLVTITETIWFPFVE